MKGSLPSIPHGTELRSDVLSARAFRYASASQEAATGKCHEYSSLEAEVDRMMRSAFYRAFHAQEGERLLSFPARTILDVQQGRAKGAL
eukprot:5778076-Prorocentrum_lima.AAC.1